MKKPPKPPRQTAPRRPAAPASPSLALVTRPIGEDGLHRRIQFMVALVLNAMHSPHSKAAYDHASPASWTGTGRMRQAKFSARPWRNGGWLPSRRKV